MAIGTIGRTSVHRVRDVDEIPTQHGRILKGWDAVDKRIRDSDEIKVEDFKEDVDTLLVFAGLFSAVTTALLIESYKFLQQDQTQTTNILLSQVYLRLANASTSPPSLDAIACIATSSCPFTPASPMKQVNYLWFSSLILSLVTASFGMLVKQWLREYVSGSFPVGKSHLRLRFFRYIGMLKWRVFKIASLLPLLLQLALGLFFVGLCLFSSQVNHELGFLTTTLVSLWASLLVLILGAPALSPMCPYKVTFLKEFMHYVRVLLNQYFDYDYSIPGGRASFSEEISQQRQISTAPFEEESFAVNQASLTEDMDILLALDRELLDDGLLETGIAGLLLPIASESSSGLTQVSYRQDQLIIPWVLEVIQNRVQNRGATRMDLTTRLPINGQLSLKAWTAVVEILAHTIINSLQHSQSKITTRNWVADAITILISDSGYPLPPSGQIALSECLRKNASTSAFIICARSYAPLFSLVLPSMIGDVVGGDAFVVLLDSGMRNVLRHLHGDDLLHAIHELLCARYGCFTIEKKTVIKHCSHENLPGFLTAHVLTTGDSRVRLDRDGGYRHLVDILLDELEEIFRSVPSSSLPIAVLTIVEVAFTYIQKWSHHHSKRILMWMTDRQALLWYLQLAKPAHEDNDGPVSRLVVAVTKDLFMGENSEMTTGDRKVMLRLVSDILKADFDPQVLEDPSVLRIDHLGLCELLLDLLRWQLQAAPDPVHLMQRALVNAWRTTLERLSDAIRMTDGPATKAEADVIRRISTLARAMDIPSDFKLNKAMDALLSALEIRNVGPATHNALQKWRSLPRTRASMNGSIEALPYSQQDSVVSLSGDVDGQIVVSNESYGT